jgi:hypothetical protein
MTPPPDRFRPVQWRELSQPDCCREARAMKLTKKQKRKYRRRAKLRQTLRAARKKN